MNNNKIDNKKFAKINDDEIIQYTTKNQNNETNKYKNIKNETIEIIDIPRRDEKDMNNIIKSQSNASY